MDGTGYRIAMARGVAIFERVAEDLLSSGEAPARARDAAADRELIRDRVRRLHKRSVRRQRLVSRRS